MEFLKFNKRNNYEIQKLDVDCRRLCFNYEANKKQMGCEQMT